MYRHFKLKAPLGRNYDVDFADTLNVKKALKVLGYYDEPKHGLTKFPDEPLFEGIERFQKDHGLRQDGYMKPGGETETALNYIQKRNQLKSSLSHVNADQLFELFNQFRAPEFHGGPRDGKCRATGTCESLA